MKTCHSKAKTLHGLRMPDQTPISLRPSTISWRECLKTRKLMLIVAATPRVSEAWHFTLRNK